jgi:hypothetical protein
MWWKSTDTKPPAINLMSCMTTPMPVQSRAVFWMRLIGETV